MARKYVADSLMVLLHSGEEPRISLSYFGGSS